LLRSPRDNFERVKATLLPARAVISFVARAEHWAR
jgi:hypothetical protein